MIDILTASPDEIRAEAARRTQRRAAGQRVIEGDPYETRVLGSGSKGMVGKLGGPKRVAAPGGKRRTKWQAEWAGYLHVLEHAGSLRGWREEGFSVALEDPDPDTHGRRVHYRPDFYVVRADGIHEIHEAKGYLEDDARKTMRWFSQRWPFLGLRVLTKKDGRWSHLLTFNCKPWPYGLLEAELMR